MLCIMLDLIQKRTIRNCLGEKMTINVKRFARVLEEDRRRLKHKHKFQFARLDTEERPPFSFSGSYLVCECGRIEWREAK